MHSIAITNTITAFTITITTIRHAAADVHVPVWIITAVAPGSFQQEIKKGLTWSQVAMYLKDGLRGLQHIHSHGMNASDSAWLW